MAINRRKMWITPVLMVFGSSKADAAKDRNMIGANCGESILRYGPPCNLRIGNQCHPRLGQECQAVRYGPSCVVRTGTSCLPRLGTPCRVLPNEPSTPGL